MKISETLKKTLQTFKSMLPIMTGVLIGKIIYNILIKKYMPRKIFSFIIIAFVCLFFGISNSQAVSLSQRLSGQILLDVERNGEAWYVYPKDQKRYYLGRPNDAFKIMRELSVGISNKDLARIEAGNGPRVAGIAEGVDENDIALSTYDQGLSGRLSGYILLQVEDNGEAWYVYPKDQKRYYLGRPNDAFQIMRELSLGISQVDLALLHKPGFDESLNQYSKYEYRKRYTLDKEEFLVDVIEIDLDNPSLKIITDTADDNDCNNYCSAMSLAEFAARNKAFAGINATYFDTSASRKNYSFYPVYNSRLNKMINEDELKYWTTGPIMAFDTLNNFYYFKDSREFKSVAYFEDTYRVKLQAALGNRPRLIEDKMNLLIEWDIDEKQRDLKAARNALAYRKDAGSGKGMLYLVIARSATVPELAEILKLMEVDYALNLDGGYSSALYYHDEYMFGPGRDVVNAILFSE